MRNDGARKALRAFFLAVYEKATQREGGRKWEVNPCAKNGQKLVAPENDVFFFDFVCVFCLSQAEAEGWHKGHSFSINFLKGEGGGGGTLLVNFVIS